MAVQNTCAGSVSKDGDRAKDEETEEHVFDLLRSKIRSHIVSNEETERHLIDKDTEELVNVKVALTELVGLLVVVFRVVI